jgi:pyrrolysine biosynthesis protein PylC
VKLAIVGGVLQGMEAAYLAKKAGYETVVIDRWPEAPALTLADEGYVLDIVKEEARAKSILSECDAVLPANENIDTLISLDHMAQDVAIPLLFDLDSYRTSSSKSLSNQLFSRLGIPMPRPWPACGYPVVVKPSGQSGSVGVSKARNEAELAEGRKRIERLDDEAIVQEFVEGPNISIEVIGNGKKHVPFVITEVILDEKYDCKMVLCPIQNISGQVQRAFKEHACRLAEALSLNGLMDVEAIVHNGEAKVLEIDARIPSQTPAAIFNATGINLVKVLTEALTGGNLKVPEPSGPGAAIYEHIAVDGEIMRSCGEGVFSEVRRPRAEKGLFGADEMITDYAPGKDRWRATVICSGSTPEEAWNKRQACLQEIMKDTHIARYINPVPGMIA